MMNKNKKNKARKWTLLWAAGIVLLLQACAPAKKKETTTIPSVAAFTVYTVSVLTQQQFSANLQGRSDIEIRPQVEGYLERIYVDEGAYVSKGQALFLINDQPYAEAVNQASAALETAVARAEKAEIEVSRLEKLVDGKVVAAVQLHRATAELNAANAARSEAAAAQKSAGIKKGFTLIKAPVSGYIGKLPYRKGSLVGRNESQPLTVLSDIGTVYAYFSMSEDDFLRFKKRYAGNSMEEKIAHIPPVTLLLPDNSAYGEAGKVELVQGQFDQSTAAITFRASFPNPGALLRSGNTGKIVLPQHNDQVIRIPQSATFELQNKVMAYLIGADNKLSSVSLTIADKDARSYIVSKGLKPGDRIVARGLERLQEGIEVKTLTQ